MKALNEVYLREAVDTLTKDIIEHIRQTDDDGNYLGTHTVIHPPLLEQLHQRVTPSTGNDAGSKSSPRERNMVDSAALYEYAKMSSAIWDWCRMAGATVDKKPVDDLRRWYIAHTSHTDRDDDWYTRELRRWEGVIRNKLEPPKQVEIQAACPVCGPDPWVDGEGSRQPNRLWLEYRLDLDGKPSNERTTCRNPNCNAVWEGEESMKELGEELDERHAA